MAYFDWNATAPLHPRAREVWLEAQERYWANPSTPYRLGVQSRLALDEAREGIAEAMEVLPEQVIFTSGATEANNGFLRNMAKQAGPGGTVWISSVEHPSVREAALAHWKKVIPIPVDSSGLVDLSWMEKQLERERPDLISVMAANNETGVIQPWREIMALAGEYSATFHCDAVQWFGKEADLHFKGASGVTLSGHKFGAPKGVGCLVLGPEWRGMKIQAGGSQEQESRAGTENIPAILAMVEAFRQRREQSLPRENRLARDHFEDRLREKLGAAIHINGADRKRIWNTCSVTLPEFRSDRWIAQLDRAGFQVSSGSACSTGKAGPSPVLRAMGREDEAIRRTIRISSGWETTPGDWEALLEAILSARKALREGGPSDGPGSVIEL